MLQRSHPCGHRHCVGRGHPERHLLIPRASRRSRAHRDLEPVSVKSAKNLAENPYANLILVRPENHEEFRLTLGYERTERRGPVFDRLRNELSMIATLTGMQDVFRLSSADVYRVLDIEALNVVDPGALERARQESAHPGANTHANLGELCGRLSRAQDLDTLLRVTVDGLADLLGYAHSQVLLLDEDGTHLFTIASHGYETAGIGAEVTLGEGLVGAAAAQCAPITIDNTSQLTKYSRTVRRAFEAAGDRCGGARPEPTTDVASGTEILVRHFVSDGSAFLDGDYLTKGVAGRLLWSLLRQYEDEGRTEFTNPEVRLDPSLDLPDFRDNFESRLILLKRRLDERAAPIRVEKTGRGRFRLLVDATLRLESVGEA